MTHATVVAWFCRDCGRWHNFSIDDMRPLRPLRTVVNDSKLKTPLEWILISPECGNSVTFNRGHHAYTAMKDKLMSWDDEHLFTAFIDRPVIETRGMK